MGEKTRILFLSANPPNTGPIRVDEEAREVFKRLEEGSNRDAFELIKHPALRPGDLQLLLMKYKPEIVHFSGHSSLAQRIFMEGPGGKGKQIATEGLVEVFRLYKDHVRIVVLNACSTRDQAQALTAVIDYTIGAGKGIGDRAAIKFAGAFYRALSFAMPVEKAFESAKAELLIQKVPRSKGLELFKREGIDSSKIFVGESDVAAEGQRAALKAALCNLIEGDVSSCESHMVRTAVLDGSVIVEQIEDAAEGIARVVESSPVGGLGQTLRAEVDSGTYRRMQEHLFASPPALGPAVPGLIVMGREDSLAAVKCLIQSSPRQDPS